MNNPVNSNNNADITATISTNKEETIMGNNAVTTENKEVITMTDNTRITKEADTMSGQVNSKAGEAVTADIQSDKEKRPMSEVERERENMRIMRALSAKKNGHKKATTSQTSNRKGHTLWQTLTAI